MWWWQHQHLATPTLTVSTPTYTTPPPGTTSLVYLLRLGWLHNLGLFSNALLSSHILLTWELPSPTATDGNWAAGFRYLGSTAWRCKPDTQRQLLSLTCTLKPSEGQVHTLTISSMIFINDIWPADGSMQEWSHRGRFLFHPLISSISLKHVERLPTSLFSKRMYKIALLHYLKYV